MASAESNDDLNQRLRSMILGNAASGEVNSHDGQQDQRSINGSSSSSSQANKKSIHSFVTAQTSNKEQHRHPDRNAQPNGDPRSHRSSTRGRGSNHGLPTTQQPEQVRHVNGHLLAQNPRQPVILSRPQSGRGGNARGANVQYGPMQHARGGARPSPFRPLNRPRRPTPEELHAQGMYLESLAEEELPRVEMTKEELAAKESFREHLEALLRGAVSENYGESAPRISLVPFGSLASGFGMPGSDMDLALISDSVPDGMPRLLEMTLLSHHLGARLLTRTRVPILKVCGRPPPELYAALCEERHRWNAMTPEEKEEHDRGPVKKKDPEVTADGPVTGNVSQPGSTNETSESTAAPAAHNEENLKPNGTHQSTLGTTHHKPGGDKGLDPGQKEKQKTLHSPATPSTPHEILSPEHLQYLHLLEAMKKDKPKELDTWITSNPPPANFDLQSALHGKLNNRSPRKEKPWYREKPLGPLDFPKHTVSILCDINFSNPLGIHNTALLHAYSTCDIRVRLLVLFVKLWAGRRKINSGYNGTLSSYGYVLMVLHYLVNVASPPVCPNLQLWETTRATQSTSWPPTRQLAQPDPSNPNHVCEGADVRFHRNETELASLARRQLLTHNREPLGVLLRNFFGYFATQGPNSPNGGYNWTRDVLSLRTAGGILSKSAKGWTGAKTTEEEGGREIKHRYLFAIEDPFELGHNVARTVTHHGIVAIRDEFRRASRILDKVGRGETHNEGPLLDTLVVEIPKKEVGDEAPEIQDNAEAQADHGRTIDDGNVSKQRISGIVGA